MKLQNTRFGEIEFGPQDVLFFKEGLIGFPLLNEFVIVSLKDDSPFRWLQSVQEPGMAFLCVLPEHFVSDYNPVLDAKTISGLGLEEETERFLLTTASIPKGAPNDMTLNLAAPILVNAATHAAVQFIIEDEAYTIKHRVFLQANRVIEKAAA